ncbi:hypothetical protein NTE_00209 [Candidatus Nitrososphaera evergladensis SR1]|uniref:Uncharacterized protein n=1 Tax=Candidatus Nitrososphaera evergladensis SR1 TaxID=1459636 RepID=A0A075MLG4_9ARCH|nr:hypothetical protein [Candidatus Nitrososphaera evergladensis]AIF82291.1 hypothetical protein NTE_00209 [Candidatus Nitrososphaera evergladensis SR1]
MNKVKISSQPVRGDVLQKALDDLDLWGEEFSRVIAKILQANGLVFDANYYYSLDDIEKPLRRFLGRENARQICEVIKIGIQVQYFSSIHDT